ncbi:MAG: hypothetical protein ACI8QD_001127 [Cyclobacteriaceae bacterium]|jgi:uncharacterized protein YyaL (SSP411 family)
MNQLSKSSSPYLRQHASNPVEWMEWSAASIQLAADQDKPILLSIGYSSCHWCHVMAHESFEDESVAQLMNQLFVNIKLDREERPDIDAIYMDAIQAMGLNGGWPLNVFLTPEQKPFYGGTYFPNEGWKKLLQSVSDAYVGNKEKLLESADKFTASIQSSHLQGLQQLPPRSIHIDLIISGYTQLSLRFDPVWGGNTGAPKFPMPSIYTMLSVLYEAYPDQKLLSHLVLTADKMAAGGIYDQLGGGFSRYSVDDEWHVPHFEKMLYDNGQLLSMYAQLFTITQHSRYAKIIIETIEWLTRDMLDSQGGYYSALDADSEGVEGKYYVWSQEELESILGDNQELIKDYFDISLDGNWEGVNVLRKLHTHESVLKKHKVHEEALFAGIISFKEKAMAIRSKRIPPGLDDKIITSWNALTLTGLVDSFMAIGDKRIEPACTRLFTFIQNHLVKDGILFHLSDKKIEAFADGYALTIQALITYYEAFFDPASLALASLLTDRMNLHFFDQIDGFYFFTNTEGERLIASKKELFDNVMPSSNAVMAVNLIKLSKHTFQNDYFERATQMVKTMSPVFSESLRDTSYWAIAALHLTRSIPEIVVIGADYQAVARSIVRNHIPIRVVAAAETPDDQHPLLADKSLTDQTIIYICYDNVCQLPTAEITVALKQIQKTNGSHK